MKKEQILALIAALYLLDIKERAAHIKAAAKENGVEEGALFKELKEAGYNPKAEKGTAAPSAENTPPPDPPKKDDEKPPAPDSEKDDEKKTAVTLRHKTEYPVYRRAGLVLKQKPGEFRVTAEQLAVLKNDKWVEIVKEDGECAIPLKK
jgi:type IV secretory pathway VirB10-like protein